MEMKRFTVIACRFFDVHGNTYHSVRCTRHSDGLTVTSGEKLRYGYGTHYEQTALEIMLGCKWLGKDKDGQEYTRCTMHLFDRENEYPIMWNVSDGLQRDAVANGVL